MSAGNRGERPADRVKGIPERGGLCVLPGRLDKAPTTELTHQVQPVNVQVDLNFGTGLHNKLVVVAEEIVAQSPDVGPDRVRRSGS